MRFINIKTLFLFGSCIILYLPLQAQESRTRIVITAGDSVYKWNAYTPDGGIRTFSIEKGTVIDIDNESHSILRMHSVCGRGDCANGADIRYYPNGLMESKGKYGYTTNVDSLKEKSRDGYLDYVGKDGYWYYWNEQGFLIRREKWVKGKLIETVHYKTTPLSAIKNNKTKH